MKTCIKHDTCFPYKIRQFEQNFEIHFSLKLSIAPDGPSPSAISRGQRQKIIPPGSIDFETEPVLPTKTVREFLATNIHASWRTLTPAFTGYKPQVIHVHDMSAAE